MELPNCFLSTAFLAGPNSVVEEGLLSSFASTAAAIALNTSHRARNTILRYKRGLHFLECRSLNFDAVRLGIHGLFLRSLLLCLEESKLFLPLGLNTAAAIALNTSHRARNTILRYKRGLHFLECRSLGFDAVRLGMHGLVLRGVLLSL